MMKKKNILLVAFAALTIHAAAQIPNAGFETWNSMGTYENPDGWTTLNDYTAASSVFTAEKGTPGSPGSSYLKLTSKTVGATVVNGIAVSGAIDPLTQQAVSGFAFNQMPASFTGKWQHMIYGSSQGSISVQLTRWNPATNSRVQVASADKTLTGMAMSWANFTIPFVYSDFQAPDSCIIILKASGSNPTNQDYLWVDNLGFSGSVAGLETPSVFSGIELYPNPVVENVVLKLQTEKAHKVVVELVDLSGNVLYSEDREIAQGVTEMLVPVSGVAKGNYLVRISSGTSRDVRSVTIN